MISNAYYPIIDAQTSTEMNSTVCFERQRRPRIFMPCLTLRPVWCIGRGSQAKSDVAEHIKAHAIYRRMNDVEKEQFDDAMIEARQLVSMTECGV